MPRRPIVARVDSGGGGGEGGDPAARAELREALARWASGVAVVATRLDGQITAMTASAFMAVSLEPPLVALAVGEHAPLAAQLQEGARFGVSLLARDQRRLAGIFADSFAVDRTGFSAEDEGAPPLLRAALAGLACRVESVHLAGDHNLVVAAVEGVRLGSPGMPLIYYDRAYRGLEGEE